MSNFKYLVCVVMMLFTLTPTTSFAAPVSAQYTATERVEMIKQLHALLIQLQARLAQLKEKSEITNKVSSPTSQGELTTAGSPFVHVKNIDTKKVSTDGTLNASTGDRIEFTWRTQGMKECNFTSSDNFNSALVRSKGYKVITAPDKTGSYEYSVGCTDTSAQYHYTKITLQVTAESKTAPKLSLEIKNMSEGSALTSSDIKVNPGDELAVRWEATDYDECELTHSSYNEIISFDTAGYYSKIVAAKPGITAIIRLECEKDMDGPDITGYKVIYVTTKDPEGINAEKG